MVIHLVLFHMSKKKHNRKVNMFALLWFFFQTAYSFKNIEFLFLSVGVRLSVEIN